VVEGTTPPAGTGTSADPMEYQAVYVGQWRVEEAGYRVN
jgi:hypothetical protein